MDSSSSESSSSSHVTGGLVTFGGSGGIDSTALLGMLQGMFDEYAKKMDDFYGRIDKQLDARGKALDRMEEVLDRMDWKLDQLPTKKDTARLKETLSSELEGNRASNDGMSDGINGDSHARALKGPVEINGRWETVPGKAGAPAERPPPRGTALWRGPLGA